MPRAPGFVLPHALLGRAIGLQYVDVPQAEVLGHVEVERGRIPPHHRVVARFGPVRAGLYRRIWLAGRERPIENGTVAVEPRATRGGAPGGLRRIERRG